MILSNLAVYIVAMAWLWLSGWEAGRGNWPWAVVAFIFGCLFVWVFWTVPE